MAEFRPSRLYRFNTLLERLGVPFRVVRVMVKGDVEGTEVQRGWGFRIVP